MLLLNRSVNLSSSLFPFNLRLYLMCVITEHISRVPKGGKYTSFSLFYRSLSFIYVCYIYELWEHSLRCFYAEECKYTLSLPLSLSLSYFSFIYLSLYCARVIRQDNISVAYIQRGIHYVVPYLSPSFLPFNSFLSLSFLLCHSLFRLFPYFLHVISKKKRDFCCLYSENYTLYRFFFFFSFVSFSSFLSFLFHLYHSFICLCPYFVHVISERNIWCLHLEYRKHTSFYFFLSYLHLLVSTNSILAITKHVIPVVLIPSEV